MVSFDIGHMAVMPIMYFYCEEMRKYKLDETKKIGSKKQDEVKIKSLSA